MNRWTVGQADRCIQCAYKEEDIDRQTDRQADWHNH